jgi:hypothetical protein
MSGTETGGGIGRWRRLALAAGAFACTLAASDALAAGGKPAKKLVNVADTRGLQPGLAKWLGDVYNTNLWLYSAVVVTTMVGMGLVLGFGVDRLVGRLGIDLGKMDHHE